MRTVSAAILLTAVTCIPVRADTLCQQVVPNLLEWTAKKDHLDFGGEDWRDFLGTVTPEGVATLGTRGGATVCAINFQTHLDRYIAVVERLDEWWGKRPPTDVRAERVRQVLLYFRNGGVPAPVSYEYSVLPLDGGVGYRVQIEVTGNRPIEHGPSFVVNQTTEVPK
jgi:hypothetical protein